MHRRRGALLIRGPSITLAVPDLYDIALAATHRQAFFNDLRAFGRAAPSVLLRRLLIRAFPVETDALGLLRLRRDALKLLGVRRILLYVLGALDL